MFHLYTLVLFTFSNSLIKLETEVMKLEIEARRKELKKLNRPGLSALAGIRHQQIKSSYDLLVNVDKNIANDIYNTVYIDKANDLNIRLYDVANNNVSLPFYTSDYIITLLIAAEMQIEALNQALHSFEVPTAHLKSDNRKRSPGIRLSDEVWEEIDLICAEQEMSLAAYFQVLALKDLEGRRKA